MNDEVLELPAGPIVSIEWLQHHLHDPRVRVLDTRGRIPAPGTPPASMRGAWEEGHVPGAAFVAWNEDFVDVEDPVPNQLAGTERFEAAARHFGIDSSTVVVAYDDSRSMFAGRLWWAFRAMGHDQVRVLDGGWTAWLASGAETSTQEVHVEPRAFAARPQPALRWTIEQVAERGGDVALVDARGRDRFAGTGSDPVGGHIPDACNVPYDELVGADGLLRPADELRAVFEAAGIDVDAPPSTIVASCGSGISASVPLLALEALAPGVGVRAAVYDGSWAEWSRSGRPIETGDGVRS